MNQTCNPTEDNSNTSSSCSCSTGQTRAPIGCPNCRKAGMTVNLMTPQNTLFKAIREQLNNQYAYYFCDNPNCDAVYYNAHDSTVFTTADLKNRVTIKDESPETPLCYCFKVLKKQALEEIAKTGKTDVFQQIQNKMKPGQSCFCEKANPRGDTCSQDILDWLEQQGLPQSIASETPTLETAPRNPCATNCCG